MLLGEVNLQEVEKFLPNVGSNIPTVWGIKPYYVPFSSP